MTVVKRLKKASAEIFQIWVYFEYLNLNNLVRCGSFFSFPENIICKHSELFAIYFSVTSIGLDIKHSMQNQNIVVSESDIKLFS